MRATHFLAADRESGRPAQNSCLPRMPMMWIPIRFTTIALAVARPTWTGPPRTV